MSKKTKATPTIIAVVYARPQTDKLKKLGLAMCPSGKLFGAKKSCAHCGAVVSEASAPALAPTCAKHGATIPCAKCLRAEKARNSRATKASAIDTTPEAPAASNEAAPVAMVAA